MGQQLGIRTCLQSSDYLNSNLYKAKAIRIHTEAHYIAIYYRQVLHMPGLYIYPNSDTMCRVKKVVFYYNGKKISSAQTHILINLG